MYELQKGDAASKLRRGRENKYSEKNLVIIC